jgi:hypothetical protein
MLIFMAQLPFARLDGIKQLTFERLEASKVELPQRKFTVSFVRFRYTPWLGTELLLKMVKFIKSNGL